MLSKIHSYRLLFGDFADWEPTKLITRGLQTVNINLILLFIYLFNVS